MARTAHVLRLRRPDWRSRQPWKTKDMAAPLLHNAGAELETAGSRIACGYLSLPGPRYHTSTTWTAVSSWRRGSWTGVDPRPQILLPLSGSGHEPSRKTPPRLLESTRAQPKWIWTGPVALCPEAERRCPESSAPGRAKLAKEGSLRRDALLSELAGAEGWEGERAHRNR